MQVLGLSQFQREMCIAHRPAAFSVGASEMISQKRMHLPTRDRLTGCHACRDVASDQQDRRFRWRGEQENGNRAENLDPPDESLFICRASSVQRTSPPFLPQD